MEIRQFVIKKNEKDFVLDALSRLEKRLKDQSAKLENAKQVFKNLKDQESELKRTLKQKQPEWKQSACKDPDISDQTIPSDIDQLFEDLKKLLLSLKKTNEEKNLQLEEEIGTVEQYKKIYTRLQNEIIDYEKQMNRYKEQLQALKKEINRKDYILNVQRDTQKKLAKELESRNIQIKRYKNQKDSQKDVYKEMKNVYKRNLDQIVEILFKYQETRQKIRNVEGSALDLQKNILRVTNQLEEKEQVIQNKLKWLHEMGEGRWVPLNSNENNEKEQEAPFTIESLRKDLTEFKNEFQHYKKLLKDWDSNIQKNMEHEKQLKDLINQVTNMFESYKEQEAGHSDKGGDNVKNELDSEQLKKLESGYEEIHSTLEQYKKVENKNESMKKRLQILEKEIEEFKKKEERYQLHIRELKKNIENIEGQREIISDKDDVHIKETYEQKIQQLHKQIKNMEMKNRELRKQMEGRSKQLNTAKKETNDKGNVPTFRTEEQKPLSHHYNVPLPSESQTTVFSPYKYANRGGGTK